MTTHSDHIAPSARPIVRRGKTRDTETPQPAILLTVPDLRSPTVDSTIPAASETELPMQLAGLPDEATEFSHDSSRNEPEQSYDNLAGEAGYSALDTSDYGEFTSEVSPSEVKEREASELAASELASEPTSDSDRRSTPASPAAKSELLDLKWGFANATVKRQLGTLGTIAAAILACTMIARAMKQDTTTPGSSLHMAAAESTELNDVSDPTREDATTVAQRPSNESSGYAASASPASMSVAESPGKSTQFSADRTVVPSTAGSAGDLDPYMAFQQQQASLAGNSAPRSEVGVNPTATPPSVVGSNPPPSNLPPTNLPPTNLPPTNPGTISSNSAPATSEWPRPVNAADVWPKNPPGDVPYQAPARPPAWSSSAQTAPPVGRQTVAQNPFSRPINSPRANVGNQPQPTQGLTNSYPSTSSQAFPRMQPMEVATRDQPEQRWRNNGSPNETPSSQNRRFNSPTQPTYRSGVIR